MFDSSGKEYPFSNTNNTYIRDMDWNNVPPTITDVKDLKPASMDFELYPAYPNPFNPSTTISYSLPQESKVNISIYDMLGQKVKDIVDDAEASGMHRHSIDMGGFGSGIYFVRIATGNTAATQKLMK